MPLYPSPFHCTVCCALFETETVYLFLSLPPSMFPASLPFQLRTWSHLLLRKQKFSDRNFSFLHPQTHLISSISSTLPGLPSLPCRRRKYLASIKGHCFTSVLDLILLLSEFNPASNVLSPPLCLSFCLSLPVSFAFQSYILFCNIIISLL